jgi:hypothetical protein
MTDAANVEMLLRHALAPVDPPEDLSVRVRTALRSITEAAAEELDGWELAAMRDPRNWVRPAAALVAGGAAGTALVIISLRQRHHRRPPSSIADLREFAEQAAHELAEEARKLTGSH